MSKTERNALIVEAYRAGKTLRDIAVEHQISHERVRQIVAREPGLLRTNRFLRRKDVDAKQLERLLRRGMSVAQIAGRVGMAETNVRVRINEAGLRAPGQGKAA